MPSPPSLGGAGLSEVAPSLRLPVRRVHLAVRRCSQRPNIDRLALDFKQCSFRRVTRVLPSNSFSVFSPLSALSAGSCPLALSGSGKPLTQGCSLNPSHLRWGCCMNYCGAPKAVGRRLQCFVELSALRGAPPRPTWLWPTRPAGHPLRPSTSAPDGVDGPGRTWYPTRVVGLAGGGRAHNALQNNSLAFSNTIGNILMRFLEMPSAWSLHYIKAHPGL